MAFVTGENILSFHQKQMLHEMFDWFAFGLTKINWNTYIPFHKDDFSPQRILEE